MKPVLRVMLGGIIGILFTLGGVALYGSLTDNPVTKAPSLPEGQSAVITHIAGPVYVIRGDETIPAFPGEILQAGDIVKVTEGAVAQVQFANKGSALLGSDTLVRFMRLTGADQKLELRTEILTGSLSYKVEKLDDSESIVIEADGTEYEVRGTEFVILKSADGTLLLVGEGNVAVTGAVEGGRVSVGPEQQLDVRPDAPPARVARLSDTNRARLASAAPLPAMPFGYAEAPKPILVEIVVNPPDSDIYIDGLKTGTGRFRSLLPEDSVIDVRVRRRGFEDKAFELTADSDTYLEIDLIPFGVEETLAEEPEEQPLLERLKEDYERRLAELKSTFADQASLADESNREAARIAARNAEIQAQLEMEKTRGDILETELAGSEAENQKLKDLIDQIQELTED